MVTQHVYDFSMKMLVFYRRCVEHLQLEASHSFCPTVVTKCNISSGTDVYIDLSIAGST